MTTSGYPRVAKLWKRGTPLASASVVYEGKPEDMYIAAMHDDTPGFERNLVSRTLAFYNNEIYLRGDDGTLTKIDAPNSAEKGLHKQWLTLELRDPWTVGGKTYASGSLLATRLDDFLAGKRDFEPPGAERAGRRQEPPVGADSGRRWLADQPLRWCAGLRHAGRVRRGQQRQ
ncbi:hypothetical protein G6F68_014486 [Rhizopus microsporus]|nr:hypothetical protein G6F68_014486 [Rhizopus microsporus]